MLATLSEPTYTLTSIPRYVYEIQTEMRHIFFRQLRRDLNKPMMNTSADWRYVVETAQNISSLYLMFRIIMMKQTHCDAITEVRHSWKKTIEKNERISTSKHFSNKSLIYKCCFMAQQLTLLTASFTLQPFTSNTNVFVWQIGFTPQTW